MPSCVVVCCGVLWCVVLLCCVVVLCCVVLCCVVLCCVVVYVLCCVVVCSGVVLCPECDHAHKHTHTLMRGFPGSGGTGAPKRGTCPQAWFVGFLSGLCRVVCRIVVPGGGNLGARRLSAEAK